MTIGIVSPGAMGSAIAGSLVAGGTRVVATLAGRSQRTRQLAERGGIEVLPDLGSVVREADVVMSIVPPEAAKEVLANIVEAARDAEAAPLVADLNAIAPATVRAAERVAAEAGCDLVDGSISGPPPWSPGTRIYLSGPRAREIAELPFDGVATIVVGPEVGSASAVKMSTASVYKGTSALLLQALRTAHANGVLAHVLDDLQLGAPELVSRIERRLAMAAAKAERYVGEMREIAATQRGARLTPALFDALAEVYEDVAGKPLARTSPEDVPSTPSLDDILDALR